MNRTLLAALTVAVAFVLSSFLTGCGGSQLDPAAQLATQDPAELLSNVKTTLQQERLTVTGLYTALQQLNSYLDQKREVREQFQLTQRERDWVEQKREGRGLLWGLPEGQRKHPLEELQRTAFTMLDAHHLDGCLLLRDAARTLRSDLGREPDAEDSARWTEYQLELARRTFDWVVRQVDLRPPAPNVPSFPAHEVLRRGTGSDEERARVFLALVEQLDVYGDQHRLDGCMLVRTVDEATAEGKKEPRERHLAGVLIGQDIYLFEPRLGIAMPSPDGKAVTTLRQLQQDKERKVAQALSHPGLPYELPSDQIDNPVLLVPASLPAVSPRMRWLETQLRGDNPAVLFKDVPASMERFEKALQYPLPTLPRLGGGQGGGEVRLWSNRAAHPVLLLARYAENVERRNQPRLQGSETPLTLPDAVVFESRQALMPGWVHDLARRIGQVRARRVYQHFDMILQRIRIDSGSPRDYLVRGRPELAVERTLQADSRLDKILEDFRSRGAPGGRMFEEWSDRLERAVDDLEFNTIWTRAEQPYSFLSAVWATPELREHLTYFMGLSKVELAMRSEWLSSQQPEHPRVPPFARGAGGSDQPSHYQEWESAADWFIRYEAMVLPYSRRQWADAAQRHLAYCRSRQHQFAAAIGTLERLEQTLGDPNSYPAGEPRTYRIFHKQAHLQRIKELRQKQATEAAAE